MKSVKCLLPLLFLVAVLFCGCTSREEKKIEEVIKRELDLLKNLDSDTTQKYLSYQELFEQMRVIFQDIDSKYSGQKKGIFLSNDTYANIFLNLIFQKYNCLPDEYQIIGFDNSPIAAESIIPITTIGQQIDVIAQTTMELLVEQMNEMKKRKPAPLQKPIHKKITPVLIRRQTTGD